MVYSVKIIETETRIVVAKVWQEGRSEGRSEGLMGTEFQFCKIRVPEMGGDDVCTAV